MIAWHSRRADAAASIATGIAVLAAVVLAGCSDTAKPSVSGNRPGLSGQSAPVPATPGGRIAAVLLSPAQLGMPTTGISVMSENSGKTTTPSMPLRPKAGQSCAMILLSAQFVGSTAHALAYCPSAAACRTVMALLRMSRVSEMDPITLIVTALAAGAALGVKDTASAMVKDAYVGLKALVRKRLGGGPDAELVLAKHEKAPETWQSPLMAELAESGADRDGDLIAAAQALLSLIDEAGGRAGKYAVDVRGAEGVQIGDHNRQDNVFNAPAGG